MNDEYRRLKQKYDDIGKQITNLYADQHVIRDLMEQVCIHENLIKVDTDPFLLDIGVDDEEAQFKCKDCFRYFTESELESK